MSNFTIIDNSSLRPMVSVAMLAYNHQDYIGRAIESVLMQNIHYSVQIVIAEDCSTDNTRAIILEYQKKYPDIIKLILQNKNVGARQNNYDLLSNLTGKYIAALEGDDFWTDPIKLQKQIFFLENHPEYSITFTNVNVVYEDGLENKVSTLTPIEENRKYSGKEILQQWIAHTSTFVFRNEKEEMKNYANFFFSYQFLYGDTPLFLYLLEFGKAYGFTDYTSSYRRHLGGALSGKDAIQDGIKYITYLKNINKAFNNKGYTRINNNRISVAYLGLLRNKEVKLSDSMKYLFKCIYYDPLLFFKIIKEKLKSKS
ncbi:TPA: glycosyltransferase [Elizabethkingia anophelis]